MLEIHRVRNGWLAKVTQPDGYGLTTITMNAWVFATPDALGEWMANVAKLAERMERDGDA